MKKFLTRHFQAQNYIKDLLSPGPVYVEYRLHNRIADIFWEKYNIVFEIQYSPLRFEEAVARTAAYRDRGHHIVWLLHKKTFGRPIVGDAERYLLTQHCYYLQGISQIFDQQQIVQKNQQVFVSKPFYVDLSKPKFRKNRLLGFCGDCEDHKKERIQTAAAFQYSNPLRIFYAKFLQILKSC